MSLQERISAERLKRKVGSTVTVLVDEVSDTGALARSAADAPEIDGVVHVGRSSKLKTGDFAQVRVTRSDTHDLYAKAV
jgi:ribosomal protein S12 methylthiotransferase